MKTSSLIKKVVLLVRADDWRLSFLPFIMGSVYLWIWWFKIEFSLRSLWLFILSFITTIGFASLGYLINEFFDQESDAKARKINKLSILNHWLILLLFITSFACTFLPWIWLPSNTLSWVLIAIQISLFLFYSLPFIRLKEHPVLSIIIDSLYAYVVPLLLSFYTFSLYAHQSIIPVWFYFFILNVFFVGVRNIIMHQVKDVIKDKLSGLRSLPMILSITKTHRLLWVVTFYETLFFMVFCNTLFNFSNYIFIISMLFYTIVCITWVKNFNVKKDDKPYLKINFLYHVLFPLCSALLMIYFDYQWIPILTLHLILLVPSSFYNSMVSIIKSIWSVIVKIILVDVRNAVSLVINMPIYWGFRLCGVNLKRENMSAVQYLKNRFIKS